jgi:asparagine synthase (glutamine-hydrolysing)
MIGFDTASRIAKGAVKVKRGDWTFYYIGDRFTEGRDPYSWFQKLRGEYSASAIGEEILGARGGVGVYPLFLSSKGFSTIPSRGAKPVRAGEILKLSGERLRDKRTFEYPEERIDDEKEAISMIIEVLNNIEEGGAIAFSGGVDSSLLGAICEGELFSICLKGSKDEEWIPKASRLLGKNVNLYVASESKVEEALDEIINFGFKNPIDVSIGTSLILLSDFVKESGFKTLILGQGADELFGGYAKYLEEDLDKALLRDLNEIDLGLARDSSIILSRDLLPRYPFLKEEMIECALKISPSLKVKNGIRKYILRRVAEKFIPKELAWRDKKAVQYSSGVQKTIRKIIKRKGFKRLKEYLEVNRDDR